MHNASLTTSLRHNCPTLWEDVSFNKDASILKRSLSGHSSDGALPSDASKVTLLLKSLEANGHGVLPTGDRTLAFVLGNGELCDAIEFACGTMCHGEEAIVECHVPRMAFDKTLGLTGSLNPPIIFHLVMLGFEPRPRKEVMTESDRLQFALDRKNVGAQLFKDNRIELASQRYSGAVSFLDYIDNLFLDKDANSLAKEIKIVCQLNRAACGLKLGDPKRAALCCTSVLMHHPGNVKALFRRASAFIALDRLGEAVADLEQLCRIEPHNIEGRRLLGKVQQRQRMREKQLFQKMVSPKGLSGFSKRANLAVPALASASAEDVVAAVDNELARRKTLGASSESVEDICIQHVINDTSDACPFAPAPFQAGQAPAFQTDEPCAENMRQSGMSADVVHAEVCAKSFVGGARAEHAVISSERCRAVVDLDSCNPKGMSADSKLDNLDSSPAVELCHEAAPVDPALEPFSVRLARFRAKAS